MTAASPTAFATALRAFFAQHLPLTRGLSPRTVLSYRDTFVLFLRFLAARHKCDVVTLELRHLGADDVLAFLDHLETTRKNSIATRNARLAAIHAFARFLVTRDPEQIEQAQRILAVPVKRGPARAVDYLEDDEIAAMLRAVSGGQRRQLRDRALLLILFNTGARVQEVLDLRAEDLQLDRPSFVRLRGKGRKERLCPLWPETVESIRNLLRTTPGSDGLPIFRNHRGGPMTRFGINTCCGVTLNELGDRPQRSPPSASIRTPVGTAPRSIYCAPESTS